MSLIDYNLRHPRVLTAKDMRERRERILSRNFGVFPELEPPKPPNKPPTLPPGGDDPMAYGDNGNNNNGATAIVNAMLGLIIILIVLGAAFFGIPKWNVWRAELQGRAELARAEQNRMIKIEEAKANLEAEKLNAEAEVERAKGAARAIEIENGKLTDTYIKYLAVRTFNTDNAKFIYVPTECGIIPVMEAGRAASLKGVNHE